MAKKKVENMENIKFDGAMNAPINNDNNVEVVAGVVEDTTPANENDNNTNIEVATLDSIVATPANIALHLEKLTSISKVVETSWFDTAYELWWLAETNACETLEFIDKNGDKRPYKNIAEFCAVNMGLKKASCYNYIKVVKHFGKVNENGVCYEIDNKYAGYSSSKLQLMSRYKEDNEESWLDTFKLLSADMTHAQIKDVLYPEQIEEKEEEEEAKADKKPAENKSGLNIVKGANIQQLYEIADSDDLKARKTEILKGIEKVLNQTDTPLKYKIVVCMTW